MAARPRSVRTGNRRGGRDRCFCGGWGRLEQSLANVRHQKATLELRLSPNNPGVHITTNPSSHHSSTSFNPQPQAQASAQLET
jgi:hypothetical protein